LRVLGELPNGPASHLISPSGEVVDEVQGVVACFNYLGQHGPLVLVLVLKLTFLVFGTVGNDLSRSFGINEVLDLLEPLVLFVDEIINAEVDEVDHLFGGDEAMGVQNGDLTVLPGTISNPLVGLKECLGFQ
jgi:hypothetical protein